MSAKDLLKAQVEDDRHFMSLIGIDYQGFEVKGEIYKGLFSPVVYFWGVKVNGCYSIVHKSKTNYAISQAINEAIDNILGSGKREGHRKGEVTLSELLLTVIEFLKNGNEKN